MAIYFPLPYIRHPPFGPGQYFRKGTGDSYIIQRCPHYPKPTPAQLALKYDIPQLADFWNDPYNQPELAEWNWCPAAGSHARPDMNQLEKNPWVRFVMFSLAQLRYQTTPPPLHRADRPYAFSTAGLIDIDWLAQTCSVGFSITPPVLVADTATIYVHQLDPARILYPLDEHSRFTRHVGSHDGHPVDWTNGSLNLAFAYPVAAGQTLALMFRLHNDIWADQTAYDAITRP